MIIYLVRHTPVEIAKGVCYGQSDVPLSSTYPADLRSLKKKFTGVRCDTVYSSPLKRCALLANDLADGAEVHVDQRLLELNFGEWELQAWDAIEGEEVRHWADHFDSYPCPNGESFEDLRARTVSLLKDVTANQGATIMVVTHGGVIRCLLAEVLGMSLLDAFNLQIDYGGVSCLSVTGSQYNILFINR